MQNYKNLKVWNDAHLFTVQIYKATVQFPKSEMYGLVSQMRRASSSIPANIAEGCGKNGDNDFAKFLNIALGSANESEYFLILSKDLQYIDLEVFQQLLDRINKIKAMLISLISKVRKAD
ncbi:MAG: four helix bundle protein [Ferruginibacter sp.]